MSDPIANASGEIARLEAILGGDPAAPAFPALAEARRRAGDPTGAERTARAGLERRPDEVSGRVALGLALLDQGRESEARKELEHVLTAVADHPLASAALDAGARGALEFPSDARPDAGEGGAAWYARAENPRLDITWGAPGETPIPAPIEDAEIEAAFEAAETDTDQIVDADRIAHEAMRAARLDEPEGLAKRPNSPFATRTMADLLERQGHDHDAEAIRSALEGASSRRRLSRAQQIETLERWLHNLQRGVE